MQNEELGFVRLEFTAAEKELITIIRDNRRQFCKRDNGIYWNGVKQDAFKTICRKLREKFRNRVRFNKQAELTPNSRGEQRFQLKCEHGKYPTGFYLDADLQNANDMIILVKITCEECVRQGRA